MLYVLCALSIVCLVLGISKYKTVHSPYTCFNLLWSVIGILLIVGNEHTYTPSNTILIACSLGIVAFNLSSITPKMVLWSRIRQNSNSYSINARALFILSVLVLLLSIVSASYSISQLFNGASLSSIREDYYTYDSSSSTIMYYLRQYFISPMRYVVVVGAIITFFHTRKIKKAILLCTLSIVLLQAITSGGRYVLMNTFFMFLCGYFVFGENSRISKKQKVLLVLISFLLVYGIIVITNDRSTFLSRNMGTWDRLYLTIYQYFAGSVTYFDSVIEAYPFVVGSTYGLNFMAGFITPIFALLTFMHLLPYPQIFNTIGTYACSVLRIGPDTYYNAMPTMFGYSFIDGSFFLVFIEAWLFGYMCKRFYTKATEGNLLYVAFYMLVFTQIWTSSQRWFFFSSDFCLAFLYMKAIMVKDNKNIEGMS